MAGLSRSGQFRANYSAQVASRANAPTEIVGLMDFLRSAAKRADSPEFNGEVRKASIRIANLLVVAATFEAANATSSTSRNRQALEVMKGMKAKSDRIPVIKLSEGTLYRYSRTGRNKNRRQKVTRGDVFFGAEFGGGTRGSTNKTMAGELKSRSTKARPAGDGYRKGGGTTNQFLRHRGQKGYFFWPAVRKHKQDIATEYLGAIQGILDKLADS